MTEHKNMRLGQCNVRAQLQLHNDICSLTGPRGAATESELDNGQTRKQSCHLYLCICQAGHGQSRLVVSGCPRQIDSDRQEQLRSCATTPASKQTGSLYRQVMRLTAAHGGRCTPRGCFVAHGHKWAKVAAESDTEGGCTMCTIA